MNSGTPPEYATLKPLLLEILSSAPADLSEHALLQLLAGHHAYFDISGLETLALFQRHFILFHYLYRLQQALWANATGHLVISALAIRLLPYQAGQHAQLDSVDPVRAYYLDLNNLRGMQQSELDDMLRHFWERLLRRDTRAEALASLGLSDPVSDAAIKQRYRELVMTHHPDRGGDTARIQVLNAAMAELLPKRNAH